jgi:crotonobetainyl-CoA:carnitine CoA-transferase CaiB-like acyl-CoA transferase
MREAMEAGALAGLRVIDAGQIIAAPFAATLLGEFGAEVIKVEQPGIGDAGRGADNHSPEFEQNARTKKSITLDLRRPEGQGLFKRLAAISDVVIENFLPGTMERWGLGYAELSAANERIVMLRVSGYGQTGPYRHKYSFDRVAMAFGGLTYVTGHPDRPPVRPGFFIADYVTGVWGAFGVLAAIHNRDVVGTGKGQMIDLSLYEAVWRLSGPLAANYARSGTVRERQANTFPGVVPADQFETGDGNYIVLHAGTDRVYGRLCETMGRPELAHDPRFVHRAGRVQRMDELHTIIGEWVRGMTLAEALRVLEDGGVPASPVNSIADIFRDPHITARENLIPVPDPVFGEMIQPGVVPKLSATPGSVRSPAPRLGEHNEEIYLNLLELTQDEYTRLRAERVI